MNDQILAEIARVTDYMVAHSEDTQELPSRAVVVACLEKLQQVLFPGHFMSGQTEAGARRGRVETLLKELSSDLIGQVRLANLHHGPECRAKEQGWDAEEIAAVFLAKLPQMREYLLSDIEALYQGDPAAYSRCEIILSYPGLYAGMAYRVAHELYSLGVPLIPRLMTEHAHSVTGIDIHPGARIGKYFCMDHGTGIVIGETTEIGDHVKIYQGVTLGALSTKSGQDLKSAKRHPTIKDHVTIYSGATILGGDTVIGENVVIGGNAFVVRSVPANMLVKMKTPELQYKESIE